MSVTDKPTPTTPSPAPAEPDTPAAALASDASAVPDSSAGDKVTASQTLSFNPDGSGSTMCMNPDGTKTTTPFNSVVGAVKLANYFGTLPEVAAAYPDRFAMRYMAAANQQTPQSQEGPTTQADANAASANPDGSESDPQTTADNQASQVPQDGTPQASGQQTPDTSGQRQSQPAGSTQESQNNAQPEAGKAAEATSQGEKSGAPATPASAESQQGDSSQEANSTNLPQPKGEASANADPEAQQGAASTNADNLPPEYAVGKHFNNGWIGLGDGVDGRVYVVQAHGKQKKASLSEICKETGYDYDQLMALNHLAPDKNGYINITNGTALELPIVSGAVLSANHTPVMDVDKASSVLDNNSFFYLKDDKKGHKKGDPKTETTFTGWCSHYVFAAINAGLPKDKQIVGPGLAKNAGPKLLKAGFTVVLTSSDQLGAYTPQKGDVVVLQGYPGQGGFIKKRDGSYEYETDGHGYIKIGKDGKPIKKQKPSPGHIAMYDGEKWVSDAKQVGPHKIWAGSDFQNHKVGMVIYRP